jgi:RHS repeat-associated protein
MLPSSEARRLHRASGFFALMYVAGTRGCTTTAGNGSDAVARAEGDFPRREPADCLGGADRVVDHLPASTTIGPLPNRNRWYDSHVGRFISEDPLGLEGGINPYAYAANNPVDLTDPFGLDPCTVSQAQTTACAIPLPGVVVVVSRGFGLPGWFGAVGAAPVDSNQLRG